MYVQARQAQADYLFDEARDVALAATPGTVWVARLQFDVIRWQAARLAPRKYCEPLVVAKMQVEPPPEALVAPPRCEAEEADWVEAYGQRYDGPR